MSSSRSLTAVLTFLSGVLLLFITLAADNIGAFAKGQQVNFRVGSQVNKAGLSLTFWVNDVRVYRNNASERTSGGAFFTEWLLPGENRLRYLVEAAGPAPEKRELMLEFFRQEDGPGKPAVLRNIPLAPLPMKGEFVFSVKDLPGNPAWNRAEAPALNDATRKAVLNEVSSFFDAVKAHHASRIVEKLSFSFRMMAPFYGIDEPEAMLKEMEKSFAAVLKKHKSLPGYSESHYELETMGGGRLILVSRKDSRPILTLSDPDQQGVTIQITHLYFAKLDGRWVVVHT